MDKEQFLEKINAIGKSIWSASHFYDAYKDLLDARNNENLLKQINRAPAFFRIATDALFLGIFSETAKIFDSRGGAYSIEKFLNVCSQHLYKLPRHIVPPEIHEPSDGEGATLAFGDPFEILGIEPPCIKKTIASLQKELGEFTCVIDNLKKIRDKYYAHLDKEYMNDFQKVIEDFPISSLQELKKLLDFASKVLNEVRTYLTSSSFAYSLNRTDLPSFLLGLHHENLDVWGNDISESINNLKFCKNPAL